MDVGTVRALGSPEGRALLRSLPPYDEAEVMRLGDRLRREGHSPDLVATLLDIHLRRSSGRAELTLDELHLMIALELQQVSGDPD